jgi:hypothetical protein
MPMRENKGTVCMPFATVASKLTQGNSTVKKNTRSNLISSPRKSILPPLQCISSFLFFLQREQIPYTRCWSLVKRVKQRLRNTVHQQPVDQFSHVAPSTSINTSNGLYQQHNVKIMQPQVATDNTDHYYHEFSYFTDIFGLEIVCNSNTSTSILNLTSVAD